MEFPGIDQVPFSRAGSFIAFAPCPPADGNRMRISTVRTNALTLRGASERAPDFYDIALYRGTQEVSYTISASPWELSLFPADNGDPVTVLFVDCETVVFDSPSLAIRLIPCKPSAWKYEPCWNEVVLFDYAGRCVHMVKALGDTVVHALELPPSTGQDAVQKERIYSIVLSSDSRVRAVLRIAATEAPWESEFSSIPTLRSLAQSHYNSWSDQCPQVAAPYREGALAAWYQMWNATVASVGNYGRRAILMSKNRLNQAGAWANCFTALALAPSHPEMAWDQLRLFFDYQTPQGALPYQVNDLECLFGYAGPPVYGWTIMKMIDKIGVEQSLLAVAELYKPLCRLTSWWYGLRDNDGDGMCQYNHGTDSGWSNATLFDMPLPVETADLGAYLVLQTEALSRMAEMLGLFDQARDWQVRSEKQLADLLAQNVFDGRFAATLSGRRTPVDSRSLLNCIPVILGTRIPLALLETLIEDLSVNGPYLSSYGYATEPCSSPQYEPNGYWRGPIWAQSTYLIFDGLVESGQSELARTVAQRFCDMCCGDYGFYENYNAQTGQGQCCPSCTWTASVFLLLAQWLAGEGLPS